MPDIKNIIFDFGGVIINIDEGNITDELIARGSKNVDKLHQYMLDNDLYNKLETGMISDQMFRDEIKKISDLDLDDNDVDDIWNTLILDFPPNRYKLLQEIRYNYRTFLLSNTNFIHWYYYQDQFRKQYGLMGLSELFEMDYYSYLMGVRKPDAEIFMMVLQDSQLVPKETLFIDDNLANCLTARQLGMYAYNIKRDEDVITLFKDGKLSVDLSDSI